MGFFSWLTCDTEVSISNCYSDRGAFTVYFLIPEKFGGGYLREDNYEGYGVFGGRDAYALVANWNAPERCCGDDNEDRGIGIEISHSGKELEYPIKIASRPMKYEDAYASERCPNQGYFYYDDEDDEDDYDYWDEDDDEDDYSYWEDDDKEDMDYD